METLMFAANVLKVALGLGFVIFLHELGHFLLAKWNGVKVEKFSIGFGPTLASYRKGVGLRIGTGSRAPVAGDPPSWGETEYILAALPLGGYVKMLGEASEDAKDEEKSTDPRAYHNKPVFARMGIITAGVIMNIFLGVACFAIVHTQAGFEMPAAIGGVFAGSPAYKAGLKGGDEILAIDGDRDISFKQLLTKVNFSGPDQVVKFTVKRPGVDKELEIGIEPKRDAGAPVPTIGLYSGKSLELAPETPFHAPPGEVVDKAKPELGFLGDDRIVAVGPEGGAIEPVEDHASLARKLDLYKDRPIVVTVARKPPADEKATSTRPSPEKPSETRVDVKVPVHRFFDFGLRLTPGPIIAVRPDSPAALAKLEAGDRIVAVAGDRDYDPMRLPEIARGSAGKPLILTVERKGAKPGATPEELAINPDDSPIWTEPFSPIPRPDPLDIPGLGLALGVEPKVAAVLEGSAAARAGLKQGAVVKSMVVTLTRGEKARSKPKPVTIRFDDQTSSWPWAFAAIQGLDWDAVELTTDKSDRPIAVRPEIDPSRFHPERGFVFLSPSRPVPPAGFARAIRLGWDETTETVMSIFSIFQRLAERRIGGNAFGGMIPIAQMAYTTASVGIVPFIHFIGILSVNLAVLNFLPIPPLDGGQFVFLAGEKIRGKPLPESFLNFATIGGVVLVLGLILVINVKDVILLVQSYL